MAKVFGVAANGIQSIFYVLDKRYPRRVMLLKTSFAKLRSEKYKHKLSRAKVIIASDMSVFRTNLQLFRLVRAPIIIFDNPAVLNCVPGIIILDIKTNDNIMEYKFSPSLIDYMTLFNAIDSKHKKRHRLGSVKINLLPKIISDNTASGFMDKFNTFLYSVTTSDNRTAIRDLIVNYVFGKMSLTEIMQQFSNNQISLSPKRTALWQIIVDYINSPQGHTLQQALHAALALENAADKTRRTVPYKQVMNKFDVDKFDLRNLIILYRKMTHH